MDAYLAATTRPKLLARAEAELLTRHQAALLDKEASGVAALLRADGVSWGGGRGGGGLGWAGAGRCCPAFTRPNAPLSALSLSTHPTLPHILSVTTWPACIACSPACPTA